MLYELGELYSLSVRGRDGDLGRIVDAYLSADGLVRYLLAATPASLGRRKALLSPFALERLYPESGELRADLARERVQESPGFKEPITRCSEDEFNGYYDYPAYWAGGRTWGSEDYPLIPETPPRNVSDTSRSLQESALRGRSSVFSANAMAGREVQAIDGALGRVETLVFDDIDWGLRGIVVDGRHAWPEKKLLVPAGWLKALDDPGDLLSVSVSKCALKACAGYDTPPVRADRRARIEEISRVLGVIVGPEEPTARQTSAPAVHGR